MSAPQEPTMFGVIEKMNEELAEVQNELEEEKKKYKEAIEKLSERNDELEMIENFSAGVYPTITKLSYKHFRDWIVNEEQMTGAAVLSETPWTLEDLGLIEGKEDMNDLICEIIEDTERDAQTDIEYYKNRVYYIHPQYSRKQVWILHNAQYDCGFDNHKNWRF